jgi:hypothetical protein
MNVRRHFVACRNLEAEYVQTILRWTASQYGDLCALWEGWRSRSPLQLVGGNGNMIVGGDCGHRRQTGDQQRRYQSETKHVHPPNCFIVPAEITAPGR